MQQQKPFSIGCFAAIIMLALAVHLIIAACLRLTGGSFTLGGEG